MNSVFEELQGDTLELYNDDDWFDVYEMNRGKSVMNYSMLDKVEMEEIEELEDNDDESSEKFEKDIQSNYYVDDYKLTALLLKEIDEYKAGKRKSPSEKLSSEFLRIMEGVLKRSNFVIYPEHYQAEFRSKAMMLFVKHWHKFNPKSVDKNFTRKKGVKHFIEDKKQWRGAFNWFSLFSWTGCTDEIKKFKKNAENNEIVGKELYGLDVE